MKIFILAPHVDDEVYSCFSIINKCIIEGYELTIAYASSGEKQKMRLEILHNELLNHYGFDRLTKLNLVELSWFPDGKSQYKDLSSKITQLDSLISDQDYLFIPALSDHQDHIITHRIAKASLRYRTSLNLKGAFMYEYMYNHDTVPSEYFEELSEVSLDTKIRILKSMNTIDNILSDTSVNSEKYVRSLATINGSRINRNYAESFKVLFLKDILFSQL